MKFAFFSLDAWEKEYLNSRIITAGGNISINYFDQPLDNTHLPQNLDFEIISIFVDSKIDQEVLSHLPNLKLIVARSMGFDHIDLKACLEKNIAVSYVPTYGSETVAEYTLGLILTLSRKIYQACQRVKVDHNFHVQGLRGFDLVGKTLGVVGTGRIGKNVVKLAKAFGMKVVAYDTLPDLEFAKTEGFEYLTLEETLQSSDIVTLHVPHMPQTHHLINKQTLAQFKKGAYFINTSRGAVVETEALVESLKEGNLAGAALDVLEEEGAIRDELDLLVSGQINEHDLSTILADHALIQMPNVIITPHNAFNSEEALQRILDTTIENIKSFISGTPQNLVPQAS